MKSTKHALVRWQQMILQKDHLLLSHHSCNILSDDLEKEECLDRYEMMQPPRPSVDKGLIDAKIEQCHEYYEKDGKRSWCGVSG